MGVLWTLLREQGELYTGDHFVYTGGMHGDGYVNHRFLAQPELRSNLLALSYELLEKTLVAANIDTTKPILLVGPKSLGADMVRSAAERYWRICGIRIKYAVVDYIKDKAGNKTYFWSADNGSLAELCTPDTKIIWMDDLMNQSSTLQNTRTIFEGYCPITAVAVFFDRGDFTAAELNVPSFVWLEQHQMKAYQPYECPMCRMQMPIRTDVGHGQRFRTKHPDYPGGFVDR